MADDGRRPRDDDQKTNFPMGGMMVIRPRDAKSSSQACQRTRPLLRVELGEQELAWPLGLESRAVQIARLSSLGGGRWQNDIKLYPRGTRQPNLPEEI